MSATLKIISALLSYPSEAVQSAAPEMASALKADTTLEPALRAELTAWIEQRAATDLLDLQSAYVDLFDRGRAMSLHLFEHVHGESRDRGQAMVSLRERYRAAGLDIAARELPDYLPLFLEFLSVLKAAEACAMLGETVHILKVLAERLEKRASPYALAFQALCALAAAKPDEAALAGLRAEECDNPDDLAALDRSWEESEIRFGPGDAADDGCPRSADMLRRIQSHDPAGAKT